MKYRCIFRPEFPWHLNYCQAVCGCDWSVGSTSRGGKSRRGSRWGRNRSPSSDRRFPAKLCSGVVSVPAEDSIRRQRPCQTTSAAATPPPAPPGLTAVRTDEEMLWTQGALGLSQSSHTGLSQDVALLGMGSGTDAAAVTTGIADMEIDGGRSAAADSSMPTPSV